jgi:hypothetical protein
MVKTPAILALLWLIALAACSKQELSDSQMREVIADLKGFMVLGMHTNEVVARLGKPQHARTISNHDYWSYWFSKVIEDDANPGRYLDPVFGVPGRFSSTAALGLKQLLWQQ